MVRTQVVVTRKNLNGNAIDKTLTIAINVLGGWHDTISNLPIGLIIPFFEAPMGIYSGKSDQSFRKSQMLRK